MSHSPQFLSFSSHPQVTLNKQSLSPGQSHHERPGPGRPGPRKPGRGPPQLCLFSCPTPTYPYRKLRTPKPLFLRELQCQKEKESLYVVTEAIETIHDTMLQSLSNTEGAGRLAILGPGHLKVQGVP